MTEGIWHGNLVIQTPAGDYTPVGDNILEEIRNAAKSAGLTSFKVKVNGVQLMTPKDLQTNSLSALRDQISIEGAEKATIKVEPYDKAA